ncbi:MAG: COX15/CtaA family protein [Candidatus Promineifilaceae bacterium]|nr:COX15/CtaA family protein [Candidatus Promineifilaceae bacterium]
MKRNRFALYAWAVLGYILLVILWGAFVRATGSGAGCGRHWPACNGQIIPRAPATETLIEFTHRVTSGFAGVLVVVLLIWAFRAYVKRHPVRRAALLSFIFIITEGAVGAGLVLLELVGNNDSVARAVWMAAHLINTFFLVAALSLTAWWASVLPADEARPALRLRGQGRSGWLPVIAMALILVVSAVGAVTALGDTLFPAGSLAEGVARDFSPTAHFLERLRVWHPLLAVLSSVYILAAAAFLAEQRPEPHMRRFARFVQVMVVVQIVAGVVNLMLLAPVAMQLLHLLLADLLWIGLVLLSAVTLAAREPAATADAEPSVERPVTAPAASH